MAIRSRAPATKPAARSAVRAPGDGPATRRLATMKATTRKVDETTRIDPSDVDGQARAQRILKRAASKHPAKTPAAKRDVATTKAVAEEAETSATAKKAVVKTTAAKTSAGKARATKTSAAKSDRPRIAKTSAAKTSVAKTVEEPAVAQTAPVAEPLDHGDSEAPSPHRRGPSGVTRTAVDRCNDPPPLSGLPLIDRVGQAAEREIARIEVIVGSNRVKPEQRTEAERRARTLASLARTLAALRQMRSDEQRRRSRDDDAIPRDLDELRRALSRRLEQMVDGRAQLPAAGDE